MKQFIKFVLAEVDVEHRLEEPTTTDSQFVGVQTVCSCSCGDYQYSEDTETADSNFIAMASQGHREHKHEIVAQRIVNASTQTLQQFLRSNQQDK